MIQNKVKMNIINLNKLINHKWTSQSLFSTPTLFKSIPNSRGFYFSNLRPFRKALSFIVKSNEMVVTFVSTLFDLSSPSAIFFRVVSIAAYSINRGVRFTKFFYMSQIRFIHIVFKLHKRIPQTFYSFSTIPVVFNMSDFVTSSFKTSIEIIKSRITHFMIDHIFNQKRVHAYQNVPVFSGKLITV